MTLMATGAVVADRSLNKLKVTVTETILAVPEGNIAIYAGSTVGLWRQLEMVTGWNFLWNGVRDRSLLDVQFAASFLYTGTDIDKKGEFNRRTESLVTSFTDNDIILAISGTAAAEYHGAVLPLDSAFEQLIQATREHSILKAA